MAKRTAGGADLHVISHDKVGADTLSRLVMTLKTCALSLSHSYQRPYTTARDAPRIQLSTHTLLRARVSVCGFLDTHFFAD